MCLDRPYGAYFLRPASGPSDRATAGCGHPETAGPGRAAAESVGGAAAAVGQADGRRHPGAGQAQAAATGHQDSKPGSPGSLRGHQGPNFSQQLVRRGRHCLRTSHCGAILNFAFVLRPCFWAQCVL